MSHLGSQYLSLNHRVMIVKTGIDSRMLDFTQQIVSAAEIVRGMRNQTVHGELQVRCSKETFQDRRNYPGGTTMRRRIFRMGGCGR